MTDTSENTSNNTFVFTPIEARILGCLIEKKYTTPDVYPLTLNSIVSAANQKTSRYPLMELDDVIVRRSLMLLVGKGYVRETFSSRVDRYEHLVSSRLNLSRPKAALLGLLMLRGPQTLAELQTRVERMAPIASLDEVQEELESLISHEDKLVIRLERAPGKREERYAHLLCGADVQLPDAGPAAVAIRAPSPDYIDRIEVLEAQVAELQAAVDALKGTCEE